MKKLLLFSACLLALGSSPVMAQTAGPEIIVVQLYHSGLNIGHIAITRGDGKTEEIEFKDQDTKDHTAATAYQRALARLYQERYTLKSTFTPGASYVITMVFEKRQ